jgi:hypothetical protein
LMMSRNQAWLIFRQHDRHRHRHRYGRERGAGVGMVFSR